MLTALYYPPCAGLRFSTPHVIQLDHLCYRQNLKNEKKTVLCSSVVRGVFYDVVAERRQPQLGNGGGLCAQLASLRCSRAKITDRRRGFGPGDTTKQSRHVLRHAWSATGSTTYAVVQLGVGFCVCRMLRAFHAYFCVPRIRDLSQTRPLSMLRRDQLSEKLEPTGAPLPL